MTSRNDITGDSIQTRATTQAYRDNYDAIFGKKKLDPEKFAAGLAQAIANAPAVEGPKHALIPDRARENYNQWLGTQFTTDFKPAWEQLSEDEQGRWIYSARHQLISEGVIDHLGNIIEPNEGSDLD